MSKNKDKKKVLFHLFSNNLEWIKEHPSIKFTPDFSNGYICPLCLNLFYEKDLDSSLPNYLTLEDIPPRSLGGKPLCLTCKSCNNKSGHELDVHLVNTILMNDLSMLLPNSKTRTSFHFDKHRADGIFEVDENGTLKLNILSESTDPKHLKMIMKNILSHQGVYQSIFPDRSSIFQLLKSLTVDIEFKKNVIERRAEVALLRIAYLLAFSTFGNGFLTIAELCKVREQILNPDKEILPKVFWLKVTVPEECAGLNIITLPEELKCFLVVFNLITESRSMQCAIVLPGPTMPGLKVYDFLSNELCNGDESVVHKAVIEHLPELNYLHKKEFSFLSRWYWQKYSKDAQWK